MTDKCKVDQIKTRRSLQSWLIKWCFKSLQKKSNNWIQIKTYSFLETCLQITSTQNQKRQTIIYWCANNHHLYFHHSKEAIAILIREIWDSKERHITDRKEMRCSVTTKNKKRTNLSHTWRINKGKSLSWRMKWSRFVTKFPKIWDLKKILSLIIVVDLIQSQSQKTLPFRKHKPMTRSKTVLQLSFSLPIAQLIRWQIFPT